MARVSGASRPNPVGPTRSSSFSFFSSALPGRSWLSQALLLLLAVFLLAGAARFWKPELCSAWCPAGTRGGAPGKDQEDLLWHPSFRSSQQQSASQSTDRGAWVPPGSSGLTADETAKLQTRLKEAEDLVRQLASVAKPGLATQASRRRLLSLWRTEDATDAAGDRYLRDLLERARVFLHGSSSASPQ